MQTHIYNKTKKSAKTEDNLSSKAEKAQIKLINQKKTKTFVLKERSSTV